MTYAKLIRYYHLYRLGLISKTEVGLAIHLWQRAAGY